MQLSLNTQSALTSPAQALVLFVPQKEEGAPLAAGAALTVDAATGGWLDEVFSRGEFSGKSLETALLHRPAGLAARLLLAVGLGKPEKFDSGELRKAAGAALRTLKPKGVRQIAFVLDGSLASPEPLQAAAEGVLLGDWEPDAHKTDPKKGEKAVDQALFLVPAETPELAAALQRGRVLAEAQNFTRDLVNEPSNRMTPSAFAAAARALAAEAGLECDTLDRTRLQQLGFGSLLAVAQGSDEPPFLVTLRYRPASPQGSAHLALVGKGVTFDTGGISIKPAEGMEKMKYDMAGAAAVLGAMKAIAQLKPAVPVTAYCPCVENMPSGRAVRPGDIVKSLNGKTVEILNTDAEGRLILIDALTYAIREGCTHLADAATLTGAIAVALGQLYAGLFSNNPELSGKTLAAARAAGERLWQLPLDDDYKEGMKSVFADIPNIGPRWGGSITAAKFIEEFVEGKPWIHLDIAGTAWLDEAKPHLAKGPSGIGVRTFCYLSETIL
jgi:leucyl aminopeptidase